MWNPNSGWVWWKHTNCMSWSCHHGHGLLLAWQETTWVHIPPKFHQNVTRNHYPLYFVDPSEGSEAAQLAMMPPETTSLMNSCKINGWKCSLMCNSKSYHDSSSAHFASTLSLGGLDPTIVFQQKHLTFSTCVLANVLWIPCGLSKYMRCKSPVEAASWSLVTRRALMGISFLGGFKPDQ